MQELILSIEAVTFVGDYGVDCDTIGTDPSWFISSEVLRVAGSTWRGSNKGLLRSYRIARRNSKVQPSLKSYLFTSHTWFASEPRDKAFAIRRSVKEMRDIHLQSCPQIASDYSKFLLNVCRVAARHLIMQDTNKRNKRINVLSAVQPLPVSPNDDSFPSWVP